MVEILFLLKRKNQRIRKAFLKMKNMVAEPKM